jgi:hypothetical protein
MRCHPPLLALALALALAVVAGVASVSTQGVLLDI